jgi:outer membrane protein assembly factor BamB
MNAGPYNSPKKEWGFASSPIIHEGRVIVQCDFLGDCFIASYELETGNEIWKTPRDEISTWSTPNYYNDGKDRQIVVNGWKHMGGYDFDTGAELWKMSGGGDAPVPVPVFAHGLIYIHSAHGRYSPIYAVDPAARGDITLARDSTTNRFIKWSIKRGGAYMPTVLVYGDYLYNMRMNGFLTCFDAKTGEVIYQDRIPDARGITASAVASDGKIYYSTEQGNVFTIRAGTEFRIIAENKLDDIVMATPAIARDMIVFRTQHSLIAVGK